MMHLVWLQTCSTLQCQICTFASMDVMQRYMHLFLTLLILLRFEVDSCIACCSRPAFQISYDSKNGSTEICGEGEGDCSGKSKSEVSACCNEIRIVQYNPWTFCVLGVCEGEFFQAHPDIFNTNYIIEPNLLNGRVHYTSLDGGLTLAFNDSLKQWYLQDATRR